jgi:hypothetical protein
MNTHVPGIRISSNARQANSLCFGRFCTLVAGERPASAGQRMIAEGKKNMKKEE